MTTAATDHKAPASAPQREQTPALIGRIWAIIAAVEAVTWAGLLVGMVLKYVTRTTEAGVQLFGALHGGAFIVYVIVTLVAAVMLRWKWWLALVALACSIPPLVTIVLEIVLARRGLLASPVRGDADAGSATPA